MGHMSSATTLEIISKSLEDSLAVAEKIGQQLKGGEVIELVGDLGSGKTAFVRGLAKGISSTDVVQSPSFTISRIYKGKNNLEIHHYDFHRLDEPGVVKEELAESLDNPNAITVIEWADTVGDVLPTERLKVIITSSGETTRNLCFKTQANRYTFFIKALQ